MRRRTFLGLLTLSCGDDVVKPITYTPWAGSAGTVAWINPPTPGDVTAPTLSTADIPVNGLTLVLTYSEALDAASVPAAGAFSLSGTSRTVSSVGVVGVVVTLTLSGAVVQGAIVNVSYTPGGAPIRDAAANNAAALVARAVTNNSTVSAPDVTAPTLSSAVVQTSGLMVILTYSEALDTLSVPAVGAYSLAGTVASIIGVSLVGATVVLAVAPAIVPSAIVNVSYTPGGAPIRDAAGNNAASLTTQATTNSSTADPPLGAAAWTMYIDARDYEGVFSSGDVVSGNLTPRVGSSTCNPVNSPTVVSGALGIGQRLAFKFVGASSQAFTAHWVASIVNGLSKQFTLALRVQRNGASGQTWAGFGKAASATNSYIEAVIAAGGQPLMRKNDGTTTATKTGGTNLGSTDHSLVWATDAAGTTGYLYVNGVLESTYVGTPLDMTALATVVLDQFRFGNTGRQNVGTGGLDGTMQVCAVSAVGIGSDATKALAIHTAWTAGDIAVSAGAQVYHLGDSLLAYAGNGARRALYDYYIGASKNIDMVGAFTAGAFADNQHSAQNGVELSSMLARANSELGSGAPFPNVKLATILGGVNDLNNVGVDVTAVETAFSNLVTAVHTKITATQATARICVATIPRIQPGVQGDTQVIAFNTWLRGTFVASWNTAHPSNQVILWDVEQALGTSTWDPSLRSDTLHLNDAGWALADSDATYGYIPAISAYINSIG